jgi:hypothetical protein
VPPNGAAWPAAITELARQIDTGRVNDGQHGNVCSSEHAEMACQHAPAPRISGTGGAGVRFSAEVMSGKYVGEPCIVVLLDGQPVGELTRAMSDSALPLLRAVQRQGRVPACKSLRQTASEGSRSSYLCRRLSRGWDGGHHRTQHRLRRPTGPHSVQHCDDQHTLKQVGRIGRVVLLALEVA